MWSSSIKTLNPYESLSSEKAKNKVQGKQTDSKKENK